MKELLILKKISGAPNTFQVLPFGQIDIEGEPPVFLDDESMDSIIAHFDRRGNRMVIDYEHQTLKDVQAPASGWISKFVKKGMDGLWAVVEWTAKAKNYIANKEYLYFSPVFWIREKDRKVVAIKNIALTNDPKVNHLKPIIAKRSFLKIDDNVLQIAKMMGVDKDDLIKYGGDSLNSQQPGRSDSEQAVLTVAKMMGVSQDDLIKYGQDSSDNGLNETDADKIKRLLNAD